MSKRKSSADLRHGFNSSCRRPSVAKLQPRGMNTVHRKPGATNVRSTSSYKALRNHADAECNNSNLPGTRKSNATRTEVTKMPKTRFNSANGWNTHTPRLKCFPVESVKKLAPNWSYSPFLAGKFTDSDVCKPVESPSIIDPSATNTWGRVLPNHGYGDTLKVGPAEESSQPKQQEEYSQQKPKQTFTMSQQHVPTEQKVNRVNQSEAMLSGRVLSPGQTHRPFVPNVQKSAISPRLSAIQNYDLCAEQGQQQKPEELSISTSLEQTQRPQVVHQKQTTPILLRSKVPWKVDDSATVDDYEVQPIGGRNAVARGNASSVNEKLDTERQVVANGHPATLEQESCGPMANMQQWEKQQQQQQHQYPNQQELSTVQSVQNAQQMYQQLQNNMIRQQEIQKMALSQQQQMRMMMKQGMRQQPAAHELKIPVQQGQANREPCSNYYEQQQIYGGQLPNSSQGVHAHKTSIPHHLMLMQQRNVGHRPSHVNPQHGWMNANNHQVIGEHPSWKGHLNSFAVDVVSPGEQGAISNDVKRYEQLKRIEATPTTSQQLPQQLPGVHYWQQGTPCPQYETEMRQLPPVQNLPEEMNRHQQSQQQQQQQQLQMNKKFAPPGFHRLSQTGRKKYPEFTAEMIRDQELLVANMRQQKIPEDVMRRQFDALLSEQRRHLTFVGGQELAEKVNHTPPRRNSRSFHEDQRPVWMGGTSPAHMMVEPMRNSTDTLNQLNAKKHQEQRGKVPEQMQQHDQRQQQIFQHTLSEQQYSTIPAHQLHNPNQRNAHHLWQQQAANHQYGTSLPTTPTYASAALPQGSSSWSQQTNGPQAQPQYHFCQCKDHQAQRQQEHQQRQIRYEVEPNRVQQQQMMNCHKTQELEHNMTSEQHEQREKMMLEEMKKEYGNGWNLSQDQRGMTLRADQPWSLLKLREFQKYIRPQKQNNGLQDAETVRAALELLKNPKAKKGLEYVAELGKKIADLKLNGAQDPSDLEKISPPPVEYLQRMQRQQRPEVSSNGLCNTRNANNPASTPISFTKIIDTSQINGYPRQYHSREKLQTYGTHKMIAEKENGSVARTIQQNHPGAVFRGYGQTMQQYSPTQAAPQNYLPQQFGPVNGQWQRFNLEKNPIMSYKFCGSDPLYQRQMEQFYRNRLNFRNPDESHIAGLTRGCDTSKEKTLVPRVLQTSPGDTVQPETLDAQPSGKPDEIHEEESSPIGEIVPKLQQSTNQSCAMRMAGNKGVMTQYLTMQQANSGNYGRPEIQEAKTIGGLTYLARKVDYIQNPALIASNNFVGSKFLQPLVSFD